MPTAIRAVSTKSPVSITLTEFDPAFTVRSVFPSGVSAKPLRFVSEIKPYSGQRVLCRRHRRPLRRRLPPSPRRPASAADQERSLSGLFPAATAPTACMAFLSKTVMSSDSVFNTYPRTAVTGFGGENAKKCGGEAETALHGLSVVECEKYNRGLPFYNLKPEIHL